MYFVYILQCSDDSYYVGSAANVLARVREHNEGKLGASFTFLRRPVRLIYSEPFQTQLEALRRERQIKRWSRAKKEALISGNPVLLHTLSKRRS